MNVKVQKFVTKTKTQFIKLNYYFKLFNIHITQIYLINMTLKWHYISMFENFDNFLVVWHGCWFDWLWSRPYGKFIDRYILYIKAIVSVCLCGQCLEDSSSHCPFPRNNSFEHTEQGVLNCLNFWPPRVCLHSGGSPKPRHGIFKDMIFRTWDFSFGTYTMWVSKTQT